ncbi:MAG: hemolysin family protein [Actinomycetia bacterium]|nr:hemolysin family protein [Actinomycetes bacterium]
MDATDIWLLTALLVLIGVAAMLGASEAALLRVRRVRLQIESDAGDSRATTMLALLDDLPRVLNTVLLVVLLVQIAAATVSGVLAARLFGSLGVTIASFVLTFVLFVYSEAIPKTYAVRHPESVARASAPLLRFLAWILKPIVSILVWFADLQAPGTGIVDPTGPTEDELRRLTSEAAATGAIERSDHVLVDRAFELGDLRVDDVYVPRLDIVAVPDTASVRTALDLAISSGHRRLPTYERDIDSIIGVVRLRDLARVGIDQPEKPVSKVAVEPLIVPESRKVVDLLGDMRDKAIHFAVVVDEFGGTAGIVTIEDIVERLVGPITPTGTSASEDIQTVDSTTWIAAGTADTDEIEDAIGRSLPRGEWNTVAGLVIALVGHFPLVGETAETDDLTFTVLEESSHRILRVRIETK